MLDYPTPMKPRCENTQHGLIVHFLIEYYVIAIENRHHGFEKWKNLEWGAGALESELKDPPGAGFPSQTIHICPNLSCKAMDNAYAFNYFAQCLLCIMGHNDTRYWQSSASETSGASGSTFVTVPSMSLRAAPPRSM